MTQPKSTVRKITMWGVLAPGQKTPLKICDTRREARDLQRAFDVPVKKLAKGKP